VIQNSDTTKRLPVGIYELRQQARILLQVLSIQIN